MKPEEKDRVLTRYNERFKKYGYAPETLGWDKHRHHLRFHVLLSLWDISDKSVLDFGCGFGDLYQHILNQGIHCNYTGVDINETLIKAGREIYPQARLIEKDVLAEEWDETFDYVFSSGVHNLKLEDNRAFIKQSFAWFRKHSRIGFAVNFCSNRVDFQKEHMHYSDPAEILELAYSYSNRIVLRNDYMPFEFTVFVDLRSGFDNDTVVYPEYVSFVRGSKA